MAKLPTQLSYDASLICGNASFSAVLAQGNCVPVSIDTVHVRGTCSGYKDRSDAVKNPGRPNIQMLDQALLPAGTEKIKVDFTLTVTPSALKPRHSNDSLLSDRIGAFIARYFELGGAQYLATRYVANLLHGSWLWRNAQVFDEGEIKVLITDNGETSVFKSSLISAKPFLELDPQHQPLANHMADVLAGRYRHLRTGESRVSRIKVCALLDASAGEAVYPSQAFMEDKSKGKPGKVLVGQYVDGNIRQAMMTRQKIGNALRRIDTWSGNQSVGGNALAVEPLGVDAQAMVAYRAKAGNDFFTLMEKRFEALEENLAGAVGFDQVHDDCHYLVSVFIRGGVLGAGKESGQ